MERICVFTPTYNRAYCIEGLYNSLVAQSCQDFYWLVVDDGSTDNTEEVINRLKDESLIHIEYVYQQNGGKPRAHNTGVKACTAPLFFCVDSDDTLEEKAIERILTRWETICSDDRIAGIVGLDGETHDKPIGNMMPADNYETTLWDLYYKQGHIGDVSLIYRTEILREYPFEVHPNEKFIAETFVYNQIDQSYRLNVLNDILIICEYRQDGYSYNARRITRENPYGYIKLKRMQIEYADSFPLKLKCTILYLVGYILSGQGLRAGISNAPHRGLAIMAAPFSLLLAKTEFQK